MIASPALAPADDAPALAILPWGDVIEEFLTPLGLDAHSYLRQADGGWLFGYVAALQAQNYRPVIMWGSREVRAPERIVHPTTGAVIWLFPAAERSFRHSPARQTMRRWLNTPVSTVKNLLRREHCRAIITQEYEDARFDRWVRLGRKLGMPVFASFQGGDRTESISKLEARLRPHSIARATGLIIPSVVERQRVQAEYGGRLPPIAAIPNPLDAGYWRAMDRVEARRALGLAPSAFVAINHGRIDIFRKGLDVLLAAWEQARGGGERGDDRLVIIGSGQDDAKFAALLAEQGACCVDWRAGYATDREHIRTWLSAADIYVTASRIEGMPVAPLEAMSCGLPIIASEAQGLADILESGEAHGGLLVKKDDPAALVQAITRLREDPALRERLGKAARRRVEEAFSLNTVGTALHGLLAPAMACFGGQLR